MAAPLFKRFIGVMAASLLVLVETAPALAVCSTHKDVVFRVTSASAAIGAIDLAVDYRSTLGEFLGSNSTVSCRNLAPNSLFAANDNDATRELGLGWLSNSGFTAPTDLARCIFNAPGAVGASDFHTTIQAAASPNGNAITMSLSVSVACSACGNGAIDPGEACDPAIAGQECCNATTCGAIVAGCTLCGNGTLNAGEACDDGNTANGDCCSSSCTSAPSTTPCGNPGTSECGVRGACNGAGTCVASLPPTGSACGSSTSDSCTLPDTCDGAGSCDANNVPSGTACGSPETTECSFPDTCSAAGTCQPNNRANGFACGDLCSGRGTCNAGSCSGGTPTVCDDGRACTTNRCDPATGACSYAVEPSEGCLATADSALRFSRGKDGKARWSWEHGPATECADFGDPVADTSYDLCVYDALGDGSYRLATSLHVPATSSWVTPDGCSWIYKDKTGANQGVRTVRLRSGTDERASIAVSARGAKLPLPAPISAEQFFAMSPDVTVQLFSDSGFCWQSVTTEARRNSASVFRSGR
jgi:cysteine-rich repeat protein